MACYYISGGADGWRAITSLTLTAAKRAASRTYQIVSNGTVSVGFRTGRGAEVETIAVRHGYAKWRDIPK